MKKKIILAVLMATLLTGCGRTIPTLENGQEAVVTFSDGTKISIDDLYEQMKSGATSTLLTMIDKKILEEDYADKIEEAEESAENTLKTLKMIYATDEDGNYSESKLISALQQLYGYSTIDMFKENAKLSYLQKFAIEDYVKGTLKDKEIEEYYDKEIVADREVLHIQIVPVTKTTMTDTEKKEAENKALEEAKAIIARLKKGESFEDLAKEKSEDEATKDDGGNLGFINKGSYGSDEFDKEVYSLKVGEFSNTPVKTTSGYEIVYIKDEKEKKSLEDVRDDIIEKIVDKKLSDDATLQVTALKEIYKAKGVDIIDTDLNRNYEKYMENYMNSAREQNNKSSSSN